MKFLETSLILFAVVVARYFIVAGLAWWILWRSGRRRWSSRRIQARPPDLRVVRSEIRWSVVTSAIFALSGAALLHAYERGWTKIYLEIGDHGWGYFLLSIVLLAVAHDTYFYWTHRLMHHPRVFRHVHRVHHESVNPTPFAAFSFHPWEGVIEAVILPALALVIPVHPAAFLVFLTAMTILGVVNHCGYELYPTGFASHPVFRQVISATHHDQHHRRVGCNFGLYFTTWDRLMRTHDAGYEEAFRASSSSRR